MADFDLNIDNIDLNDKKTWKLLCEGKSLGVFQLDTHLGQSTCRNVKPTNIKELADVITLLRPGCLEGKLEDGVNILNHYVKRKHGKEPADSIHPSLDSILGHTYNLLLFQEQAILISKQIAGFSLEKADELRKILGKKISEKFAQMKIDFLKGCEQTGIVKRDVAEKIFDWISSAQRYSFNQCLSPKTLVETEDGMETLCELKIGTRILTEDNKYTRVINKFDNGQQELFEIITESGKSIVCTLDHKFTCEDNIERPLYQILFEGRQIITIDSV